MIVWGGEGRGILADGGSYDPATDSWTPLAPTSLGGRMSHAAVWTGDALLIWGGVTGYGGTDTILITSTGVRYDPASGAWSPLSNAGRPGASRFPIAVWTGSRMLAFSPPGFPYGLDVSHGNGGYSASYDPAADRWEAVPHPPGAGFECSVPAPPSPAWTGDSVLLCDGDCARYLPGSGVWLSLVARGQPGHTCIGQIALWTGTRMIIWGPGPQFSGIWTPGL